ncbi:hypothetical protein GCM10027093_33640 [Paraburkholderia jirisanensis]
MSGRLKLHVGRLQRAFAFDRLLLRTPALFLFALRIGYLRMGDVHR